MQLCAYAIAEIKKKLRKTQIKYKIDEVGSSSVFLKLYLNFSKTERRDSCKSCSC